MSETPDQPSLVYLAVDVSGLAEQIARHLHRLGQSDAQPEPTEDPEEPAPAPQGSGIVELPMSALSGAVARPSEVQPVPDLPGEPQPEVLPPDFNPLPHARDEDATQYMPGARPLRRRVPRSPSGNA